MRGAKRRPRHGMQVVASLYTPVSLTVHSKSMMLSCMIKIQRHVTCGHGGQRIASSVSHYHVGHTPVPTQRLDDVSATWSHLFPRLPCRTGLFVSTTHAKRDILAWPRIEYVRTRHHHIVSHTNVTHQSDNFYLFLFLTFSLI